MKKTQRRIATGARQRWISEQLRAVAASCPYTQTNPADCPLFEVRKLPLPELVAWFAGLRPDEKEYLMLYHECCLLVRWEREHGNDNAALREQWRQLVAAKRAGTKPRRVPAAGAQARLEPA